jgi:hypothetical protein
MHCWLTLGILEMLGRCPPQIKRIVGYESQRTGGHCWVFPDETRSNGSHSWTVFFVLERLGRRYYMVVYNFSCNLGIS